MARNLSTIIWNTEKETRTRNLNNFPAAVLSKDESGSSNIFLNGDSQTLTIFLGFLGCSCFFKMFHSFIEVSLSKTWCQVVGSGCQVDVSESNSDHAAITPDYILVLSHPEDMEVDKLDKRLHLQGHNTAKCTIRRGEDFANRRNSQAQWPLVGLCAAPKL